MAKSFYDTIFEQLLLENPMLPGPDNNTMDADQGVQDFADDGTDPHAFDVQGIGQHKDKIVGRFMQQIQSFASKLEPQAIKSSTFGQIKDNVNSIYKEIDKVNV